MRRYTITFIIFVTITIIDAGKEFDLIIRPNQRLNEILSERVNWKGYGLYTAIPKVIMLCESLDAVKNDDVILNFTAGKSGFKYFYRLGLNVTRDVKMTKTDTYNYMKSGTKITLLQYFNSSTPCQELFFKIHKSRIDLTKFDLNKCTMKKGYYEFDINDVNHSLHHIIRNMIYMRLINLNRYYFERGNVLCALHIYDILPPLKKDGNVRNDDIEIIN